MSTYWQKSAARLSQAMRLDTVEVYYSEPTIDDIGDTTDTLHLLGTYSANVTTPQEPLTGEFRGITRPHEHIISLDYDVELPVDKKLFIKVIRARQGIIGVPLEVKTLSGGLLGQTIMASDEKN